MTGLLRLCNSQLIYILHPRTADWEGTDDVFVTYEERTEMFLNYDQQSEKAHGFYSAVLPQNYIHKSSEQNSEQ
jgi:hypothetical protein